MADIRTKEELYTSFAEVGKVLSHGKRIELLDVLSQGERSVEVLSERIGTSITTTSAHLQIMRRSGLVTSRRDGTHIYYSLAGFDVLELLECFRSVARNRYGRVQFALDQYLGLAEERTFSYEELSLRMSQGDLVVLDVRPPEEYAAGHIPGAISIPLERLPEEVEMAIVGRVSKESGFQNDGFACGDVEVVVYCRGAYCSFASEALKILKSHNLRAVRLSDGFTQWRLAGYGVEV